MFLLIDHKTFFPNIVTEVNKRSLISIRFAVMNARWQTLGQSFVQWCQQPRCSSSWYPILLTSSRFLFSNQTFIPRHWGLGQERMRRAETGSWFQLKSLSEYKFIWVKTSVCDRIKCVHMHALHNKLPCYPSTPSVSLFGHLLPAYKNYWHIWKHIGGLIHSTKGLFDVILYFFLFLLLIFFNYRINSVVELDPKLKRAYTGLNNWCFCGWWFWWCSAIFA